LISQLISGEKYLISLWSGFHQSTVKAVKRLGAIMEEEIAGIMNDGSSNIDIIPN
jgi:hypothetical protein